MSSPLPAPRVRVLLSSLLVSLALLVPGTVAQFGSFVTQYALPSAFSPVAIAVGQSGALYAASTTQVLSFASSSSQPSTIATRTALVSATWMAAQPGSDLLLLADNGGRRFTLVDGATGATPYADLTQFKAPQVCGFINNQRVVLVDLTGTTAQGLQVSVISLAGASGSVFSINTPSALGSLVGFTTGYADGLFVLSFESGGVQIYSANTDLLVRSFMATSDNAIAFLAAAVASDSLGRLYLMQSTVLSGSQVEFIAVNATSSLLEVNAQLGTANGASTAPLAVRSSVGSTGVRQAALAVDATGRLYGINADVVQVFGGVVAGQPFPAPLTASTAGYYLGQFSNDGNGAPFQQPVFVTFDAATGDRYIVDAGAGRVVVQLAGGAYLRELSNFPAGALLEEARVAGGLVFVSEPFYSSAAPGTLYVQSTASGSAVTAITTDGQGNSLADGNFVAFDLDASGTVFIPLTTVSSDGLTVTVRVAAISNTGAAVPTKSFAISGSQPSIGGSAAIINDFRIDAVNNIAYIAYEGGSAGGSVVGYSLAAGTLGTVVHTFSTWGAGLNPFTSPFGLDVDSAGRVYVGCLAQGVIVLDPSTGAYITNFQAYYSTAADATTNSVTVEPATGHVFMTDLSLERVVIVQGFTAPAVSSSSSAAPPSAVSSSSAGGGGGVAVGDPQFVGFRGQSFQVHGIDGHVYSLISEPTLQVNALFVFLRGGQCPAVEGRPAENCWTHPGSYIGAIAFQHRDDEDGSIHRVLVTAGGAASGLAGVELDGDEVAGETAQAGGLSVERLSAYEVRVSTPHFDFELSNSDLFLNEQVRPLVSLKQIAPHGLLGQTWQLRKRILEGAVEDYAVSGNELFGSDSLFDRFTLSTEEGEKERAGKAESDE